MARIDKFGWIRGRGSKQKASKIVRNLNKMFGGTGDKYKASLLGGKGSRGYYPLIEKRK